MSCSTGWWSGVVGGEVARWAAESVVEGDGCGEGQEFGGQAAAQGVQLAGAVGFEAEHVLGRVDDALDALAQRGQVWAAAALVFAAGPDDAGVQGARRGLEGASGVALVADHGDGAVA